MALQSNYVDGVLLPSQIKNLRHLEGLAPSWFIWGLPGEVDKLRKRPHSPGGGSGKVDDPTTAGTLDNAHDAMRSKRAGGVGLLMSTVCPGFVGLDLDNVIAGDKVHTLGLQAIEHFKGGYVEISPSGTGLRIFALGALPAGTPKGSTAIVDGVKFEAYPAGTHRFLRTTGALVPGTRGEVVNCQVGLDWLAGAMIASKPGSPDNASVKGEEFASYGLDAVFAELSRYRPDKDGDAVIEAIQSAISSQPRGKLAEAWAGSVSPWEGDHSTADLFMACEAIRRGAACLDDVVAVWLASGLGKRPKLKRKDYRGSTVDRAARVVLAELRNKGDKDGRVTATAPLPDGLAAALALSGDQLTYTKGGRLEAGENTVVVLLRNDPALSGLLGFNELGQRAMRLKSWTVFDRGAADAPGPLVDDDVTRAGMYFLREWGLKIDRKELGRGLEAAARDASFDPLADRLRALGEQWDGVRRVDAWLVDYLKVDTADCAEYIRTVGRCFLVGAVARALTPGCQFDTVLALEGAGGAGKSTAFKVLAEAVAPGLFTDAVPDVSNAVSLVEAAGGKWIIEIAELAGVRRAADIEALKAALTRRNDTIRRPYAERPEELPRRFVFVASTNRSEYLADSSGALLRRFWPVKTLATEKDPIDREALARVAGQLWGEAVRLFEAGAKWHLEESDGAAFKQWTAGRELRREDGAFADELVTLLSDWVLDHVAQGQSSGKRIADIARAVGDMRTVEGDLAARNRLADSLRALGMQSIKKGGVKKWYFTPDAARAALLTREQAQKQCLAAA
jgi:predicted P-loop ATPase